ncbi:MAG TPA: hypothetical protein V6C93_04855 [Allocoleopsis sp.]
MPQRMSRRRFVLYSSLGFVVAVHDSFTPTEASQTLAERSWRYCSSCGVLFHNGSGRGRCPNNPEGHAAAGFQFIIGYVSNGCVDDTPTKQSRWRKCSKCLTMYYNGGDATSKRCSAGGFHSRDDRKCYNLLVNRLHGPVLNPENEFMQGGWRFCGRCSALFFNGYLDNKGVCPSGGAHAALGDMFVLEHL